ncbi:MAG: hypothetical protein DIJKHBIC_04342 [Thermoanaerobaculia bacterium]|nr:hypothetical protein [Thermoanaerobaculia bacterium]
MAEQRPRISAELLEEEKRIVGPLWYATEYLCEFAEGAVFSADLIPSALDHGITPLFG